MALPLDTSVIFTCKILSSYRSSQKHGIIITPAPQPAPHGIWPIARANRLHSSRRNGQCRAQQIRCCPIRDPMAAPMGGWTQWTVRNASEEAANRPGQKQELGAQNRHRAPRNRIVRRHRTGTGPLLEESLDRNRGRKGCVLRRSIPGLRNRGFKFSKISVS